MINDFEQIKAADIDENLIKLIGDDWMLVCAGDIKQYNMMTASWGCAGVLWNKPIAISFIRPQRLTYEFVEKSGYYTLSFFGEEQRSLLNVMGTRSGREMNKMQVDGLEALETPSGNVAFTEAKLILECRKIYQDDIKPELFLSPEIHQRYPSKDYHRFYIGEIVHAWKKG